MTSSLEMTEAESLEANARRYGNGAVTVLRLASGRLAVLGVMRRLLGVVETLEEAERLSREDTSTYELETLKLKAAVSAEDLGL